MVRGEVGEARWQSGPVSPGERPDGQITCADTLIDFSGAARLRAAVRPGPVTAP